MKYQSYFLRVRYFNKFLHYQPLALTKTYGGHVFGRSFKNKKKHIFHFGMVKSTFSFQVRDLLTYGSLIVGIDSILFYIGYILRLRKASAISCNRCYLIYSNDFLLVSFFCPKPLTPKKTA